MVYGVSAYRLYGSNATAPHPLPGRRTIGDIVRRYLVLDSPDVSDARTRVLWGRDAGGVANLRREAAVRLADARMGGQLHQPGRAAAGIRAALAIAHRLQDASAPPHELAAMWIYDRAATLVDELVRTDPLCARAVRDEVVRLAEQAELNRIHVRTSVIRSGFDDLIANVYTRDDEAGDGRLTGRGLRLIQALNGKPHPGILAVLFEPALFALPVRRSQVETEIARLLTAAGGGASAEYLTNAPALRREVARRTRSRRELFAYYPAVVFMPRVVDAITQAERARALLASVAR
jgi:hypothetical protein